MRSFLFMILLLAARQISAQDNLWSGTPEKLLQAPAGVKEKAGVLRKWKDHLKAWGLDNNYTYALSASARLHSDGWSGGLQHLRQKAAGKKVLWQLHFAELKHEKEVKQQYTSGVFRYLGKSRPYAFGKINNAYTLQLAYGREQLLMPALIDGNLSLSLRYSGGPALALLKPYYLELIYVDYRPEQVAYLQTERYTEANAATFLQPGTILGKGPWSKGLSEIQYIPGLFAELAFALESRRPASFVQTLTFGANAALYTSGIALMAERKAYPYQASFFVGLALGKRWK